MNPLDHSINTKTYPHNAHMRVGGITLGCTWLNGHVQHQHHAPTACPKAPVCRANGGTTITANEYYNADFEFDAHAAAAEAHVAATTAQWELHTRSNDEAVSAQRPVEYNAWETFHAQHDTARFFKQRRYITLAFPQLLTVCGVHLMHIPYLFFLFRNQNPFPCNSPMCMY